MVAVPSSFWPDTAPEATDSVPLTALAKGRIATIVAISPPSDSIEAEVVRRLRELGFLAGEQVRVIARGMGGIEPIAVRIGTATFALRRFEADCIQVQPVQTGPGNTAVATGAK